jgi:hypothetical protein
MLGSAVTVLSGYITSTIMVPNFWWFATMGFSHKNNLRPPSIN